MFICVFEVFSETHQRDKHQDWFTIMFRKDLQINSGLSRILGSELRTLGL